MAVSARTHYSKVLNEMNERIVCLYKKGHYSEAFNMANKAIEIAIKVFGSGHYYVTTFAEDLELINKKITSLENEIYIPSQVPVKKVVSWKLVSVLVLLMLTFGAVVATKTMGHKEGIVYASIPATPDLPDASKLPYYRVNASFYPAEKTVQGEEEVFFELPEAKSEILFNLYFNRYKNNDLNNSEMRRYAYQNGMDEGSIDILWVSYQGKKLSFQQAGEILKVDFKNDSLAPGRQSLKIGFIVKTPYIADRNGGNANGTWLGNWLPTLSADGKVYKPTEIGDPFINLSSTYEFNFAVPMDYQLVLSNIDNVQEQGYIKTYHGKLEMVRDLPIFLNHGYQETSMSDGQTQIHYYYLDPKGSGQVMDAAAKAMAYYKANVGEYPWKQLNIVENDMYLQGMEYSTMILISGKAIDGNAGGTVFHEVGHQWFYNIIGSDQYNAPFLDEGLVEFFEARAWENVVPRYDSKVRGLGQNLAAFGSWEQYRAVHYRMGEKLFENLYVTMGKNKFDNFIKEYYNKYKFGLVTADEFRRFLIEEAGPGAAKFF